VTDTALLSAEELVTYRKAQAIARSVLEEIRPAIRPGVTEGQLLQRCRELMDARGATDYWWFGVPAVVLAGARLRDSMEGDEYQPGETPLSDNDMVTIDVAPEIHGHWGDCARSYFLKNGRLVAGADAGPEQLDGTAAEQVLHAHLLRVARPGMLFSELHAQIAQRMQALGYQNLDFLGNFGHSIGRDVHARAFIDANCKSPLGSVPLFTLEPHIARPGHALAFKYEEIYHFEGEQLQLL
jgi:Xaa-Pro aminopeptidase